MQETLQEITNTPRRDVRIDREVGVLYGVKIIGRSSRNGRLYPNETLQEAIPLYENSKVNLDHPEGDPNRPRSYQDRFGVIRNVTLRENDGLYADFRFNPKHSVAEQLLWDAQNAPENVGFSHNVEAIIRQEDGQVVVEKILAVRSVDLVADPATTSGLFETYAARPASPAEVLAGQETTSDAKPNPLLPLCRALLKECRLRIPHLEKMVDEKILEQIAENGDTLAERLLENQLLLLKELHTQWPGDAKPVSREQFVPENPVDAKTFVKLIKN